MNVNEVSLYVLFVFHLHITDMVDVVIGKCKKLNLWDTKEPKLFQSKVVLTPLTPSKQFPCIVSSVIDNDDKRESFIATKDDHPLAGKIIHDKMDTVSETPLNEPQTTEAVASDNAKSIKRRHSVKKGTPGKRNAKSGKISTVVVHEEGDVHQGKQAEETGSNIVNTDGLHSVVCESVKKVVVTVSGGEDACMSSAISSGCISNTTLTETTTHSFGQKYTNSTQFDNDNVSKSQSSVAISDSSVKDGNKQPAKDIMDKTINAKKLSSPESNRKRKYKDSERISTALANPSMSPKKGKVDAPDKMGDKELSGSAKSIPSAGLDNSELHQKPPGDISIGNDSSKNSTGNSSANIRSFLQLHERKESISSISSQTATQQDESITSPMGSPQHGPHSNYSIQSWDSGVDISPHVPEVPPSPVKISGSKESSSGSETVSSAGISSMGEQGKSCTII